MGSGASASDARRDIQREDVEPSRETRAERKPEFHDMTVEDGESTELNKKVESRREARNEEVRNPKFQDVTEDVEPRWECQEPREDDVKGAELHGVTSVPSRGAVAEAKTSQEVEPDQPVSHTVDIQSSDGSTATTAEERDEAVEEIESMFKTTMNEAATETEEVPLAFESFLHNNGILYSCFSQHGNRVYVDDSKGLLPFPNEWYKQGRFISGTNEVTSQAQAPLSTHDIPSEPAVTEDDRASGVYIQGKGTVMTYMFEERANICRYFEAQSGLWLLLPLQWEMNIDFVRHRIQQVMGALPGLVDQKEITAALRQCNYDPDEVISVYLTIFGDILFQPAQGAQTYSELNSFRSHLEKDRVIEDLKQKLHTKEKDNENLFQRNNYLARDSQYLSDLVQHLNQRVAELEADQQEAREKIRALLSRRTTAPPAKQPPKPSVDLQQLQQVSRLTRDLNVSNKQLRSTVRHALADLQNQLQQLRAAAERAAQAGEGSGGELDELRSFYRKEALERKALYNKLLELQGNIRVFCRCRGGSGPGAGGCLEAPSEQEVLVTQKGSKKKFHFDKVYPSSASQEQVFEGTLPIISSCADGYNICILAYGQTGSGKTYTMMGPKDKPGVNIRSVRELLHICKERENITYTLKISMLEIYNESLNDLLSKNPTSHLEIRTQGKSVTVPGLTHVEVKTEDDILNVMEMGEKNRTIASTKMNIESSRSHLILTLSVEGTDSVSGVTSRGTLTLCDLAGSERISKTEAKGQRLVEAAAINKSLTSLGQVFSALKCSALHVPFRNSKLTHLLQPCLSGDAKACVFVNVSPDVKNVVETLSTLQFGSSIRQVALGKAIQHITPAKNIKTDK